MDISAPDAGRDADGKMWKLMKYTKVNGQWIPVRKYKIQLAWWNPTPTVVKKVLQAINPEYFNVTFHDPYTNELVTKKMYVGDREAPYQMWGHDRKLYSRLAFDLIEQ